MSYSLPPSWHHRLKQLHSHHAPLFALVCFCFDAMVFLAFQTVSGGCDFLRKGGYGVGKVERGGEGVCRGEGGYEGRVWGRKGGG